MRILAYIVLAILIEGCCDHNCMVEKAYSKLKPPIIVIAKKCDGFAGCSVVIRDSTLLMGNMSSRGNIFGASYNVGDTIK